MNCWAIANTVQQPNNSSCICTTNYTWNPNLSCQLDCAKAITNISGSFIWIRPYVLIEVNCGALNCTIKQYSTGLKINQTACECIPTFLWNDVSLVCQRNCSAANNSTGNYNLTTCQCYQGYYWNITIPACVKIPSSNTPPSRSSCTNGSIPFTDRNGTQPAANGSACNCLPGTYWDAFGGFCNPSC